MKVLHLLRKNSHLKASFILNQIVSHIDYQPLVAYYEERTQDFDGGFSNSDGVNFETIALNKESSLISKLVFKLIKKIVGKAKRNLLDTIKTKNPDVIHLHYGTDAGLYLPILSKLTIPTVVSFYGYECSGFPRTLFGLGKWYLRSRVFKHATFILAMSEDMKKDLLALECPAEKIKVHYYGTDVQHFCQEPNLKGDNLVKFLIISGFAPQKGHQYLIEAFARAHCKNPYIRLTIVGAGPIKRDIERWVKSSGVASAIFMPGPVVYGSKAHLQVFKQHDVFIHPSITDVNGDKEGIPGAIVEAMAAGLPVISTFHAGIPFIIQNGKEGLLFEERDIEGLTKGILQLAENPDMRKALARCAKKRALSDLDLKINEKELEKIYNQLINQ